MRKLPAWALPALRLWERKAGHENFLSGTWGGVRVFIYRNPDRRDESDATHILCFGAKADDFRHHGAVDQNTETQS